MKKFLSLFLFLPVLAQAGTVEVIVSEAGMLQAAIEEGGLIQPIKESRDLKITGELNGTDIAYLRQLISADNEAYPVPGTLSADEGVQVLDLSDVRIVAGGNPYLVTPSPRSDIPTVECFNTEDDVFGHSLFISSASLKSIILPMSVKTLEPACLLGCRELTDVVISEGTEIIGPIAFSGCSSLKNVYIPSTLKRIEVNAFNGCESLSKVTVRAVTPPAYGEGCFDNPELYTLEIDVDADCAGEAFANYASAEGWSLFNIVVVKKVSTGISDVPAGVNTAKSEKRYRLDGRTMNGNSKGVYIQKGRKILAK